MAEVQFSPQSRADLLAAWLYISQDSPAGADRFLERVHDKFLLLAEHPRIGRRRRSSGREVRGIAIGDYVILYCPIAVGIEVVRVVSGRMNLDILGDA